MLLGSFDKHIDNGGINIHVKDSESGISIHMDTSYFGYPSVTTELNGWGHLTADDLKEIGLMFIGVSENIKNQK